MKKSGVLALVLMLAVMAVLGGCAKKEVKTNYWNVREKASSGGDKYEYYAVLYSSDINSANKIDEIWVNVSDTNKDYVTLDFAFGSGSEDGSLKYSKQTFTANTKVAAEAGGWVRLCDGLGSSYKYAIVTVYDTMHFNEIVFVTADNKAVKSTISRAGERSANHASGKEYDLEDHTGHDHSVEEKTEEDEFLADKIVDEHDDFKYDTVLDLYNKAIAKYPEPVSEDTSSSVE